MKVRYESDKMTAYLVGNRLSLQFDDIIEPYEWMVPPLLRGAVVHALKRPRRPELLHVAVDRIEYGS